MATANDSTWEVVGDSFCNATLVDAIEPEIKLSQSAFLMSIKAIVRRCLIDLAEADEEGSDLSIFLDENKWSVEENEEPPILVQYDDMVPTLYQSLSALQVPVNAHSSLVDRILFQTWAARDYYVAVPKVLLMEVCIDVYAADEYAA